MAKELLDEEVRDTETYRAHGDLTEGKLSALFHVVNDLDAEVTVTFLGSHHLDEDAEDATQLMSTTLAAGQTLYETLTDPWDRVFVEVQASSAPTSGDARVYMTKHED